MGLEFWLARDLQELLGYKQWRSLASPDRGGRKNQSRASDEAGMSTDFTDFAFSAFADEVWGV